MIYNGNICPGCGRMITENDDIVVCPECATPQHRECYEKENKCVNAHLHAEGYEWKNENAPQKTSFLRKKEAVQDNREDDELSPCPNCGNMNPKGSKQCSKCGMKLVVFGIDLATEIKQQNNPQAGNESIPTYNAPFTLGEGEGFQEKAEEEKEENTPQSEEPQAEVQNEAEPVSAETEEKPSSSEIQPEAVPTPEQIENSLIGAIQHSGHREYFDSYIDSVHINLVANMVGPNAYKYIEKFKAMEMGKKVSFNWAAFFFAPYWFFYRKLYKPGIIILTVTMLLSILITPSMLEMNEIMLKLAEAMENMGADMYVNDALFEQFTETYVSAVSPVILYFAANLTVSLIAGFRANKLYKKYIINSSKLVMKARSKPEAGNLIARLGGVSPIALLGAYLGAQLISSFASYLMF